LYDASQLSNGGVIDTAIAQLSHSPPPFLAL